LRTCIFCGGPARSREDAWPQWLVKLVTRGRQGVTSRQFGTDQTREWKSTRRPVVVRRVCSTCNSGWMSRLEMRAKPTIGKLVRRQRVDINAATQLAIAEWCVKTAMVFDSTPGESAALYYSQDDRDLLYNALGLRRLGLSMPPQTRVWTTRPSLVSRDAGKTSPPPVDWPSSPRQLKSSSHATPRPVRDRSIGRGWRDGPWDPGALGVRSRGHPGTAKGVDDHHTPIPRGVESAARRPTFTPSAALSADTRKRCSSKPRTRWSRHSALWTSSVPHADSRTGSSHREAF